MHRVALARDVRELKESRPRKIEKVRACVRASLRMNDVVCVRAFLHIAQLREWIAAGKYELNAFAPGTRT
jgi:hypothetical protein